MFSNPKVLIISTTNSTYRLRRKNNEHFISDGMIPQLFGRPEIRCKPTDIATIKVGKIASFEVVNPWGEKGILNTSIVVRITPVTLSSRLTEVVNEFLRWLSRRITYSILEPAYLRRSIHNISITYRKGDC